MYLRMILSNKVINCVWFIQVACGLISVIAEDWNLSSLKSSNTLEAGLDSIFRKNGDEEE